MATINTHDGTLSIRFSRFEKIFGLVRDLDLPLSSVSDVSSEPSGLAAVRGLRAPGLGMPGVRAVGTWRGRGHKSLVSVSRGQGAVSAAVSGSRYDRILIGVDDPQRYVDQINAARTRP